MSFTKTQDTTDMTNLKADIQTVISNRGGGREAGALSRYESERNTINGRSTKNGKRLGLDYIDRMISEGRDANALRHCQMVLDLIALT
tara:strand:- start:1443 stop:1706 length:264 start_codon:yes stop_codon:yes gene_type:complete